MTNRILVIDDDSPKASEIERIITGRLGFAVEFITHAQNALDWLRRNLQLLPDAVIISNKKSEEEQIAFIRELNLLCPALPVILFIGFDSHVKITKDTVDVFQILMKPVSLPALEFALRNAVRMKRMHGYIGWLESRIAGRCDFGDIVGSNKTMMEVLLQAKKAAQNDSPVLLSGETGTGKELLARAIHSASARGKNPFIVIDGKSLDAKNAYAFLFGQETRNLDGGFDFTLGKLREADGGTLLLREPGLLPEPVQKALQQIIQTGEVRATENKRGVRVNVRFIFSQRDASVGNMALADATAIALPPLRERPEDIHPLSDHFVALYSASEQKFIRGLSDRARQWVMQHPWPGNIAQLSHMLRRAVIVCAGDVIELGDLQFSSGEKSLAPSKPTDTDGAVRPLRSIEEEAIRYALAHCGGSMTRAARSLCIGRSTLYRKVSEMNLKPEHYISRANQTTRPMMSVSSNPRS